MKKSIKIAVWSSVFGIFLGISCSALPGKRNIKPRSLEHLQSAYLQFFPLKTHKDNREGRVGIHLGYREGDYKITVDFSGLNKNSLEILFEDTMYVLRNFLGGVKGKIAFISDDANRAKFLKELIRKDKSIRPEENNYPKDSIILNCYVGTECNCFNNWHFWNRV